MPKTDLNLTGKTAAPTEYVILRQHLTGPPTSSTTAGSQSARAHEQWDRATTVQARSAEHAIRVHAETNKITDGVYIAIPARSFKPVKVTAELQTTLKIAPA